MGDYREEPLYEKSSVEKFRDFLRTTSYSAEDVSFPIIEVYESRESIRPVELYLDCKEVEETLPAFLNKIKAYTGTEPVTRKRTLSIKIKV